MKKINLIKLETLDTALYPQEDKYPSGNIIAKGLMFDSSKPEIDKRFFVCNLDGFPIFRTSLVKSIEKIKDGYTITTLNSKYKIEVIPFGKN
jgi:hypothetical protein